MRKFFVAIFLIAFCFLALSPKPAYASSFLTKVSTDKTSYNHDETVKILFTITNNSLFNANLTFNTSQIYDYIIYQGSKEVYNWSKGRFFADVITNLKFQSRETKAFSEKWDMKDNSGKVVGDGIYKIVFFVKSQPSEQVESASCEFTIGNVQFEPSFSDVKDYFISKQLEVLKNKGIVKGYPDGTFKGERNLSRAEAIVLILRTLGYEAGSFSSNTFTDVPKTHWAFNYIEKGVELGAIKGKTSTTFEPATPIKRGEFVVVMMKVLNFQLLDNPSPFIDVDENYFGYREIVTAFNLGIVQGKEVKDAKLYFYPNDYITRTEAILIIGRAIELSQ